MLLMYALVVLAQFNSVVELQEDDGDPLLPPQRGSFANSQAKIVFVPREIRSKL